MAKKNFVVDTSEVGGIINNREPRNKLVVIDYEDKKVLAIVTGGQFLSDGRISNAWYVRLVNIDLTIDTETISYLYKNIYEYKGPHKMVMTIV